MKQRLAALSQRYATALRKHLGQRSDASLRPALRLGAEAVGLGLEARELARIHRQALDSLEPAGQISGAVRQARRFLAQATAVLKQADHVARGTQGAAGGSRSPRKPGAGKSNAAPPSQTDKRKFLKESLQLQKRLRLLTHRALAAQEDERRKISCDLRDEIAQTLLGINVRLLSLKANARSDPKGLKAEIASARRLVIDSARFVRAFARDLHRQRHG